MTPLDAIVGQYDLDLIRNSGDKRIEELSSCNRIGLVDELYEGKLRGPVDGDKKIELAFLRPYLGEVDVKEADRVGLELLLRRPVAFYVRQSTDAVALQSAFYPKTAVINSLLAVWWKGRVRCTDLGQE